MLADNFLRDNLMEEVRLTYDEGIDNGFVYEDWKTALTNGVAEYNASRPFVRVGMDMGWQKRSSGRKYDSNSGHAFLVGTRTRKPIARCLKSKFCRICSYHMTRKHLTNDQVPEHECTVNHEGSSGSMEADALIEMTEELHDSRFTSLASVITDDDSKMKAICRWSNDDWLRDKGFLIIDKKELIV
jgi:hypothetical protein